MIFFTGRRIIVRHVLGLGHLPQHLHVGLLREDFFQCQRHRCRVVLRVGEEAPEIHEHRRRSRQPGHQIRVLPDSRLGVEDDGAGAGDVGRDHIERDAGSHHVLRNPRPVVRAFGGEHILYPVRFELVFSSVEVRLSQDPINKARREINVLGDLLPLHRLVSALVISQRNL